MHVLHKILCIIEINKCLVAKILLTNVTKTNEHSNVATFVHALIETAFPSPNNIRTGDGIVSNFVGVAVEGVATLCSFIV